MKLYFTKETENSLITFIKTDDLDEKNLIYTSELYIELDEMIRININVHKFFQTGFEIDSLVQEVHLHLIEKFRIFSWNEETGFDKFDPEKGGAYSYCNRMIKNFLIQLQEKNQRKRDRLGFTSIDDDENYYKETYHEVVSDFDNKEIIETLIRTVKKNRNTLFSKEDDKIICDNIILILEDERININNKKSFINIYKNIQKVKGYKINKVLNIIKTVYLKVKRNYIELNVS